MNLGEQKKVRQVQPVQAPAVPVPATPAPVKEPVPA